MHSFEVNKNIELTELVERNKVTPWGLWPTIGFSSIVLMASFILQALVIIGFILITKLKNPAIDIKYSFTHFLGLIVALSAIISSPFCIALTILFAKLRKGFQIKDYLNLKKISTKELKTWLFFLCIFIISYDAFTHILNRPIVPSSMVATYKTAYFTPIIYIALVLVAPLFEEILFRGFLFKGIRCSKLGSIGAIGITAFVWSLIHIQYDVYDILWIFIGGLLLGVARLKSDSVYVPIAMHSLMNLIATVEVAVYVNFFT